MSYASQGPTTPDLSFLSGLDPAVGIVALVTIVVVQVLYFIGPGIRERLRPAAPPAPALPPVETAPQLPVIPPALPQAIDQADRLSAEFIAHLKTQLTDLKQQLVDAKQELGDRARRIADLERQVERLEQDLERARWQRGGDGR